MKSQYDFSEGKRGRIAPPEPEPKGKARITIRLDEDLIDHFLKEADASGGAIGYQTLINEALRQHVEGQAPSSKRPSAASSAKRSKPQANLRTCHLDRSGVKRSAVPAMPV
jgi:uncharacterized protein (DUF4415 family)